MGWLDGHLSLPFKNGKSFRLYDSSIGHEVDDGGFHKKSTVRKLTPEEIAALPELFAKDTFWKYNRSKDGRVMGIGSMEEVREHRRRKKRKEAKKDA